MVVACQVVVLLLAFLLEVCTRFQFDSALSLRKCLQYAIYDNVDVDLTGAVPRFAAWFMQPNKKELRVEDRPLAELFLPDLDVFDLKKLLKRNGVSYSAVGRKADLNGLLQPAVDASNRASGNSASSRLAPLLRLIRNARLLRLHHLHLLLSRANRAPPR